jgi:hypothetical protein
MYVILNKQVSLLYNLALKRLSKNFAKQTSVVSCIMVMIKCFKAIGGLLHFEYSVPGKIILKSIPQNYKKNFWMCVLNQLSYK